MSTIAVIGNSYDENDSFMNDMVFNGEILEYDYARMFVTIKGLVPYLDDIDTFVCMGDYPDGYYNKNKQYIVLDDDKKKNKFVELLKTGVTTGYELYTR